MRKEQSTVHLVAFGKSLGMDGDDDKLNCGEPDATERQNVEIGISSEAILQGGQNNSRVMVHIKAGTLSGIVEPLLPGEKQLFIFKGIPYARAPVGALRFQVIMPNQC